MPKTPGWKKLLQTGSYTWTPSLDGLRKKLTKGLEIRVDPPEARRGDEIAVLVVVSEPLPDLKVGLVCTEHYDEISHSGESSSRTTSKAIAHESWQPLPGAGEHSVRLAIPPGAPFSYEGSCLSYRWEVVARGSRDRGLDALTSHEIGVRP